MANEYFHRTPTSTGNRSVYTISVWIKKQGIEKSLLDLSFLGSGDGTTYAIAGTGAFGATYNNRAFVRNGGSNTGYFDRLFRDLGAWTNFLWSVDTTQSGGGNRIKLYVNGADVGELSADIALNTLTNINTTNIHSIGTFNLSAGPGYTSGYDTSANYSDYFFVDGQALTPDVFGFYKEGKGYQSSGTTQATDFRPGQWSPHSPRKIKTEIERKGGFGANGFYLPMNDSSNFGADFHCAPNSIIKLKGEDLPQPRNGAPTTSDAYVSQLRSDPYAANLVLAVPGISTSTSATILSNGHFDSNTTGWTVGTATGTLVAANGELEIQRVSSNGTHCYQAITTEAGKRYTVSFDTRSSLSGSSYITKFQVGTSINGDELLSRIDTDSTTMVHKTASFTATGTTAYVTLGSNYTANSFWDNIVVKQEDAPRDYSADIKGSGSNKTLTPNGAAGVGYEIPGYYGSAMTLVGSGDYFDAGSSSDFDFGSGDFTVEYWQNANSFAGDPGLGIWDDANNQRSWLVYQNPSSYPRFFVSTDGTSGVSVQASIAIPTNQWTHFCMERNGSNLVGYVNGVCVGVNTTLGTQSIFTPADPFLIGKWSTSYYIDGQIQDLRVYKGVAKYKGGFDIPKPYTPVGIESWRQTSDTCNGNNFATMNPLASTATHTNGNLTVQPSNSVNYSASISNLMVNSGKWYCELRYDEESTGLIISGISELENLGFRDIYGGASGTNYFGQSIETNDTAGIRFEPTANDGDIISMYMDLDSSPITCSFTVNGGSATTYNSNDLSYNYNNLIPGRTYGFVAADAQSAVTGIQATFNFGKNPTFAGQTAAGTYTDANGKGLFKYQPPAGYLALCEDNLPTPAIADPGEHFKTVLYTGDGNEGHSITGVGFKPDLVWIKCRSHADNHTLSDTVRGPGLALYSDLTNAEHASTIRIQSFNDDGFTTGSSGDTNTSGRTFCAWCWKAGGPAVSNNDGSIAAQISVNQDAGFSILSYTGNGTSGTVGHGLGKTPNIVICKNRTDNSTNWSVNGNFAGLIYGTNKLLLQQTGGIVADTNEVTSANATTITLGNSSATNDTTDQQIAYCWTEVPGFSKFGSYTGIGGSNGAFINCGFKPAFLMIKRTDAAGEWWMYDSSRGPTNPIPRMLMANNTSDEQEDSSSYLLDFVSNGFKWRSGLAAAQGNGNTYLYMAFAESPFQTANAK